MNASHVQVYGWVEVGGNVSTNSVKPGGRHEMLGTGTIVFYGRLVYLDVFEQRRYCGFIYRCRLSGDDFPPIGWFSDQTK
jgi:hypothetical protein